MGLKVPKGQHLWVTINKPKSKETWAITSDDARLKYNLYNVTNEGWKKVKTGKSPKDFTSEIGSI